MTTPLVSKRNMQAFTLVELLTVIAIIGMLVGLLLPGIMAVREASRRARAKTEVSAIQHALKLYYNEYTKWPTNLVGTESEGTAGGIEVKESVVKMLSGSVAFNSDLDKSNPRRRAFMQMPNSVALTPDGSFLDPWGTTYRYMCDFNYDNTLTLTFDGSPTLTLPNVGVAVWSRGKNRRDESGPNPPADDVRTWQ